MRRRDVLYGLAGAAGRAVAARAEPAAPALAAALARWDGDEHPDLKGVVVRAGGAVVAERYYNGDGPDTLHDIRSAGKSVTSLLVGAAIDRGLIESLSDPVQRYLPAARGTAIGEVRLADVLTMRSGLAADDEAPRSPGNEDRFDLAPDPVAFLLGVPRAAPPGSVYVYNSLTAYAAGLVVEAASGMRASAFADKALFQPLGVSRFDWASDAAGHTKGQGNLSLSARDLGEIGQMVLDKGMHSGRRILSGSWIADSLQPRVRISDVDPYADGYGYFWYTRTHLVGGRPVVAHFASGNGGNKIYVIPARDMVVAITSSAYGHGYGQRRSQAILLALLEA